MNPLFQVITTGDENGCSSPFDPDEKEWVEYTDRFSNYFTANGITDGARKHAIL